MTARAPDEQREQHGARRERDDDAPGRPAPVGPFDDREGERTYGDREHERAEQVGEGGGRLARLAKEAPRRNERRQTDEEVDEEHRAPALPVDEHAAQRRPGRGRDGARRAPERSRSRTPLERELGQEQ